MSSSASSVSKKQKTNFSRSSCDYSQDSSMSESPAFHGFPDHMAEAELNFDLHDLINDQEQKPDSKVKVVKPPPILFGQVFHALVKQLNNKGFPAGNGKSQALRSCFVNAVLDEIVYHLNVTIKHSDEKARIQIVPKLCFKELIHFLVLPDSKDKFDFFTDHHLALPVTRVIVVEPKNGDPYEALTHCNTVTVCCVWLGQVSRMTIWPTNFQFLAFAPTPSIGYFCRTTTNNLN